MKVSVIIPFKNEKEYAPKTVKAVADYMEEKSVDYEMVAVDDSTDGTFEILKALTKTYKNLKVVKGWTPPAYGKAVRRGFAEAKGDILIPFNGDLCDSLDDVMKYIKVINSGYDMAFGSRYMKGGGFINYPSNKILFSKLGNLFIMLLFRVRCSDITNTFKGYSRHAYKTINPQANRYDIGIEMALKGIRAGLKYKTVPIFWTGRVYGVSKMNVIKSVFSHWKLAMKIFFRIV